MILLWYDPDEEPEVHILNMNLKEISEFGQK
jgi:hypothetical protein